MDPTEPTNAFIIAQHLSYLAIALPVTWAVGRTLYKNGAAFLVDTFRGKETLAESVNHLLVVGFYLVNFGWVIRGVKETSVVYTVNGVIENVAAKLGTVLLVLGAMHFFNLYVFNRIRNRALQRDAQLPPLMPSQRIAVDFAASVPR